MNKILFGLIVAALMGGCTSARVSQSLASGAIGCPANQIQITNETATVTGLHNFNAACGGKKYICSYHQSSGINCTEAASMASSPEEVGGL